MLFFGACAHAGRGPRPAGRGAARRRGGVPVGFDTGAADAAHGGGFDLDRQVWPEGARSVAFRAEALARCCPMPQGGAVESTGTVLVGVGRLTVPRKRRLEQSLGKR